MCLVLGGHVSQHGAQITFWSRRGGTQLINQLIKMHILADGWGFRHLLSLKIKLGGTVLSKKGSMPSQLGGQGLRRHGRHQLGRGFMQALISEHFFMLPNSFPW